METKCTNKNNGGTYFLAEKLVSFLKKISLVEYIKLICMRFGRCKTKEDKIQKCRLAIDIFVALKWLLVFVLWVFSVNFILATALVVYLIAINLFTYFYYHVWMPPFSSSREDAKRRFVALMQAITFNIFSFSYLYAIPAKDNFMWTSSGNNGLDAFLFSINNSFISSYNLVTPQTQLAYIISTSQIITTFMFLTIILSNSLPENKGGEK